MPLQEITRFESKCRIKRFLHISYSNQYFLIFKKQATQIFTKENQYEKSKFLCTIIALALLVTVFVPVTAMAASPDYFFTFNYSDAGEHREPSHPKGDTEQCWVIQLYQTGSSNMSSSNVFMPKMNREGANNVDIWHTFSNYVPPYRINYQTVVSEVDQMYLSMKRDDKGSTATRLYVTGAYNP